MQQKVAHDTVETNNVQTKKGGLISEISVKLKSIFSKKSNEEEE